MGVKIRFAANNTEFIVPRIDDDQIDDLFYQEDEIGEMRHSAFMIECGLEEDPPDGPDIPPVPWGDALLAQQQASHSDSSADSKQFQSYSPVSSPTRRAPPPRSRSTDDIEQLEEELSPKTPPSRRRLVAAKSGSLHAMKTAACRKSPPARSNSSDKIGDTDLNLAFAKTNKASPRSAKRFVRTKSGTSHGLAAAAAAAMKNIEERAKDQSSSTPTETNPQPNSPRRLTRAMSGTPRVLGEAAIAARKAITEKQQKTETPPRSPVRRLVATKSGTLHGMRKAASEATQADPEKQTRKGPVRRLVAAKSGTLHGMRKANNDTLARPPRPESPRNAPKNGDSRWDSPTSEKREVEKIIYKNGKKTTIYKDTAPKSPFKDEDIPPTPPRPPIRRTYSTSGSSESGSSDFLSDIASDDDNASNISISTNGSDDCSSPTKPYERHFMNGDKKMKKMKVKKKAKDSPSSPKKSTSTKTTLRVHNGRTNSPSTSPGRLSTTKKFRAKSMGNLDIPPAFLNK